MKTLETTQDLVQLVSKDAAEWRSEADAYARRVANVDARDAWRAVNDNGFGGLNTPFAKELKQLVFLAELDETPLAAE